MYQKGNVRGQKKMNFNEKQTSKTGFEAYSSEMFDADFAQVSPSPSVSNVRSSLKNHF